MALDFALWRMAKVVSVEDEQAGLRIKARIMHTDARTENEEDIVWCYPMLPKLLHVNPKLGECVLVTTAIMGAPHGLRFFLGPFISQPYFLSYDSHEFSAKRLLPGEKIVAPLPDPSLDPENNGTLPDRDDIALQGRGNADVVLKTDELRLRCGFKIDSHGNVADSLKYNKEDFGYIQMCYRAMRDNQGESFKSAINIVADRINLLSHQAEPKLNLAEPGLVTNEKMNRILDECHPLVYGDWLIDFLIQLIGVFVRHTHSFAMNPPTFNVHDWSVLTTPLKTFLSKSVRCN